MLQLEASEDERGIENLKQAVELYKNNGDFDSSGRLLKQVGDYFDKNGASELSAQYYLQAAEIFSLTKYKNHEI